MTSDDAGVGKSVPAAIVTFGRVEFFYPWHGVGPYPGPVGDEEKDMRISVDETRCCSSGQCAALAPEVFDQRDDDGIVLLLDATPPEAVRDAVRAAALACPAAAIQIDP